jgi:hypothetical protein
MAIARAMDGTHVIHWILCSASRRLTCIERSMPNGSECSVLYEGLPVATHVSTSGRDLEAWMHRIRRSWESAGWMSVAQSDPGLG